LNPVGAEWQWRFSPLDDAEAREICGWRYPGPYAQYDVGEEAIQTFLDPANAYFGAHNAEGSLVGFCCFGPDAQVSGGAYDEAGLDVGFGLRPDLIGKAWGGGFAQGLLAFGRERFATSVFRVTIAAWNSRSLRLHEHLGFRRTGAFCRTSDGLEFIQMVSATEPPANSPTFTRSPSTPRT
jgi:RimJ/RimL family protein N-acetyltransferase